ncbi:hypothetical protein OG21DRAFT_1607673 [Imleria badia]|nr:hypothetical protein OG21DRAFT_1607673 [Imleria badia]
MDGQSIAHLEYQLSRPTYVFTDAFGCPSLHVPEGWRLLSVSPRATRAIDINFKNHSGTYLSAQPQIFAVGFRVEEDDNFAYILSRFSSWRQEINKETEDRIISQRDQSPSAGRCDALGRLLVELPDGPPEYSSFGHFPLVVRTVENNGSGVTKTTMSAVPVSDDSNCPSDRRLGAQKGVRQFDEKRKSAQDVPSIQAVGITNVPVYGVQSDGPIVVLTAPVLRDDNFVYLFERLVERLDISTPLGAWHHATILSPCGGPRKEG